MSRLLLAAAVAAILLAVGAFVPVNGKTLVERWNAAPSASQFAARGWSEVVTGWDRLWGVKPSGKPAPRQGAKSTGAARTGQPGPTSGQKPALEPVEHHTEADRSAVDRIVAEHAADRPAPRR
jgi:hypothetical protein